MKLLNAADLQSSAWDKIKKHLEDRIQEIHLELESPKGVEDTATLRGRIKEIRQLIDKIEPKEIKTTREKLQQ